MGVRKERKKGKIKDEKKRGEKKEKNERKGGGWKKKQKRGRGMGLWGRGAWVLRRTGPHTNNARST